VVTKEDKAAAKPKAKAPAKPKAPAKAKVAEKAKAPAKATPKTGAREVKVTLTKSVIGRLKSHKDCVRGLGLRRINHTVTVIDTPENRGMINKVSYMVSVEES
jgi:large subunit ribosomal protein L30